MSGGAGLLIVASHIIDPATTSEEQYEQFYHTERIPKTLAFDVPHRYKQGLHYKLQRLISADEQHPDGIKWEGDSRAETCKATEQFPNFVIYPNSNMTMLYTRMVRQRNAKMLHGGVSKAFGGERVENFVGFEDRMYRYVGTYNVDGMEEKVAPPKTLVLDMLDGSLDGPALLHGGFEANYRPPQRFIRAPSYRRTTLMKRLDSKKVPRYVAMHEFTREPERLHEEVVFEWPEMNAVRAVLELKFAMGSTILEL